MIWDVVMKQKICKKCMIEKEIEDFCLQKSAIDGLYSWCKDCAKKYRKLYYLKHKEIESKINQNWRENNPNYFQKWRKENPEKVRHYTKTSLLKNKEKIQLRIQKWRKENKEYIREYNLRWRENNRSRVRERFNKYRKEKYQKDINYRLAYSVRTRLRIALKTNKKSQKSLKYIGCSLEKLKKHLESQFQPEMTWENYGEWHIDHIVPLSSFDLSQEDNIRKACHYTNLQPLWSKDNFKKGNKK